MDQLKEVFGTDRGRKPLNRPDNLYDLMANENVLNTRKNPINIYASIKKPYWYRRTTLKLGFWLFGTKLKAPSDPVK